MIKIFKLAASIFGILCTGAFLTLIIEYEIDFVLGLGITISTVLAICAGLGLYEDIKDEGGF